MKLQDLKENELRLDNTEKAIIVSMEVAPTERMAYAVLTGARNAVTSREQLEIGGFINVNDNDKTATLTNKGRDILTSENLVDEMGELTDRGKELMSRYRQDKDEWEQVE